MILLLTLQGSCCNRINPCILNHGDCDSDADCAGDLVCGNNNCEPLWDTPTDPGNDCCVQP